MAGIVTVTLNPALDVSTSVDRVVAERKLRCGPPHADPGGGGLNVSRAIRELGGESLALYLAGGPTGERLHELLEQAGVGHRALPTAGATRENVTVTETSTALQFRFQMPGPRVEPTEWQGVLEALDRLSPRPAYLVASGSLPPGVPDDFYARAGRAAAGIGARVVLDTSGAALRVAVESGGIHLIKPNLRELEQLASRQALDEAGQEAAAEEIVAAGRCDVVVVSLGAAGALVVSAEGRTRMRAPTVPIRSKVGAGDSTVAGLVLALARGLPLAEAARFGVAAGAAAVMTAGTELCRRTDVERLYERMRAAS